jgi:hypothetical protein
MAIPQPDRNRIAISSAWIFFGFGVLDWLLLAGLPRLGLSFGGLTRGLIGILMIRLAVLAIFWVSFAAAGSLLQLRGSGLQPPTLHLGWVSFLLIYLFIFGSELYGLYIEPFDLRTTQIRLEGPTHPDGKPLRILQISDIHVERITRRERDLIQRAQELQPDLIFLTGDYTNLDYLDDPLALADARRVLSEFRAPYGVFAVTGSVETAPGVKALFGGLPIHLLEDQIYPISIGEKSIAIIGVSNLNRRRDEQALTELLKSVPASAYRILLYHTPDLIETADKGGIDLYLAGHTHGGQVRLPFYGAVVTMSAYGKQYESGLYRLNPTTLYVSRGVGMEGMGLPRVRFLCPPEIVLVELGSPVQS